MAWAQDHACSLLNMLKYIFMRRRRQISARSSVLRRLKLLIQLTEWAPKYVDALPILNADDIQDRVNQYVTKMGKQISNNISS